MPLLHPITIHIFPHRELLLDKLAHAQAQGSLILDGSAGIHAPHALARQLARQLRIPLPESAPHPMAITIRAGDQISLIAQMMDIETTGYCPTLRAREHLAILRQPLENHFQRELIWYVPDRQTAIAEEDFFLLNPLLSELPIALKIYCLEAPVLPAHWSVLPHLSQHHCAEKSSEPAHAPFVSPLTAEPWLTVLPRAETAGISGIDELAKHGLRAIEAGSYTLGLDLLDHAARIASPHPASNTLRLLTDGLRIGLERFEEVADRTLPDLPLNDRQRGQFLQHRGWGRVMTGRPAEAQPLLEEAMCLLHSTPPTTEYLYLQNIYALTLFRLGQRDQAMRMGRSIALSLRLQGAPSPHLIDLSSMNTARFLLSMNQIEEAAQFFERAFATHDGLRTLGDHLMRHVYLGRIAARQDQHHIARRHHLRAALYWLASDLRDALPARVARLLLGNRLPERLAWPAAVSDALYRLLHESAIVSEIHLDPPDIDVPDFVFLPEHPDILCEQLIFARDWTIATSHQQVPRPIYDGAETRLAQLALTIMRQTGATPIPTSARTLVVDDGLGTDMPDTLQQAATIAHRLQIPCLALVDVDLQRTDWAITLVPTIQLQWPEAGKCIVSFTRYRPPIQLQNTAARVLGLLEVDQPKRISELNARLHEPVPVSLLDELIALRLIRLALPSLAENAMECDLVSAG